MITTFMYDQTGLASYMAPGETRWRVRAPGPPSGWIYPNATHSGSAGMPGNPISIKFVLAISDGTIDNAAWEGKGAFSFEMSRTAATLCAEAKGAQVSDLLAELGGPSVGPSNNLFAGQVSASELARAALRAALSNEISDDFAR